MIELSAPDYALAALTLAALDNKADALCTAVATGMVDSWMGRSDPPTEPGDDGQPSGPPVDSRITAFSILVQPCGACNTAIPVLGPRVCDVCFHRGFCPICAEWHGAKLCPEVAAVIAEQEAVERAERRETNRERIAAILTRYMEEPVYGEEVV